MPTRLPASGKMEMPTVGNMEILSVGKTNMLSLEDLVLPAGWMPRREMLAWWLSVLMAGIVALAMDVEELKEPKSLRQEECRMGDQGSGFTRGGYWMV